jgi:hypothetical protein
MAEFNGEALSATLGAEARTMRDVAHGDGEALAVAGGKAVLEVYPTVGVARVTTSDARVEVYRVPGYSLNAAVRRVVFEQGTDDKRTRLLVHGDGKVSFHPVAAVPQSPRTPETAPDDAEATIPLSPAPEAATADQAGAAPEAERSEAGEPEPVTLTGRLGRDPWFTVQDETPTAGFPFAVNDQGKTTWHRVVVFDEAAEQLREDRQIKKGRLVQVTGQQVVRQEPTAAGGVRKSRELHANSITRLTASKPEPRPAR